MVLEYNIHYLTCYDLHGLKSLIMIPPFYDWMAFFYSLSYGNCYKISLGVLECVFPVFDSFPALFFFSSPFFSLIITNYFLQRKKRKSEKLKIKKKKIKYREERRKREKNRNIYHICHYHLQLSSWIPYL